MIDHQAALIYAMVMASAADSDMTDAELARIGEIVSHLPIFASFDTERLPEITNHCAVLLSDDDGLTWSTPITSNVSPRKSITRSSCNKPPARGGSSPTPR